MAEKAVGMCRDSIAQVYSWFTSVLDATGMGGFYLAAVFVALAFGFLLARFGNPLSLGSDFAEVGVRTARNAFSDGKYGSGWKVRSDPNYKGKYAKRSNEKSGHRATHKKDIRYREV